MHYTFMNESTTTHEFQANLHTIYTLDIYLVRSINIWVHKANLKLLPVAAGRGDVDLAS